MVQRQVFLKDGVVIFLFNFIQGFSFLYLEIIFLFQKLCYSFEEELFFSVTIILLKKSF